MQAWNARYEIIEDEEPFYGEIPGIDGVWATGKTLGECREKLASTLEDWGLFSVAQGRVFLLFVSDYMVLTVAAVGVVMSS